MTDSLLASIPSDLGWGLIGALLVRGLLAGIPRIVDAVSKAMTEQATAQRLAEQTRLTEAQTEAADHAEVRSLRERVDALEKRLREQEAACGQELERAETLHRVTRDQLAALDAEFRRFRASATSGHTPPTD